MKYHGMKRLFRRSVGIFLLSMRAGKGINQKFFWLLVKRIAARTKIPAGNWEVELPEQTQSTVSTTTQK